MLARILFAVVFGLTLTASAQLPRLKVSEDQRHLIKEDGTPFFYLGDTAWELFHRLSREEADLYLEDRVKKGFNVIQAVALAEFWGLTDPNPYGHLPLIDNDPARPREEYFQHVDYIVNKAASLGMYVGFLPTWGDKVNKKWGQGPEIFTPENACVFGEWVGRRYKDKPIIWIMGGDRPIENEQHRLIFRAMAEGVRSGDGGRNLMTYHPMGGRSSSEYVHQEPWLDFNMIQSGHGNRDAPNYKAIARDLALQPPKPTLDGEPAYEDHPVRSDKTKTEWFDQWDVRKLCYWGIFAGACGHTYGTHSIWAFWDGKNKKPADQRTPWPEALHLPGSTQVGHARRLIESRPMLTRIPDQTLITSENPDGPDHVQATRDSTGSYAFIYSASGRPFKVVLTKLTGRTLRAWWWDPRKGELAGDAIDFESSGGEREFTPPTSGAGQDWVLVLDDAAKNYVAPGSGRP